MNIVINILEIWIIYYGLIIVYIINIINQYIKLPLLDY